MEISKETSDLYPDLIEAGCLAKAMQHALRKYNSSLRVTELDDGMQFVVYVRVEDGSRFSQVYIAAHERLFLFDFWSKGVMLAQGRTPDLVAMIAAIDKWILGQIKTAQLTHEFGFVTAEGSATAYEEGTEVEHRWQSYLNAMSHPEFVDLVRIASTRPQLRSLFPFTSLNMLCFSRYTGYPYSADLPYIRPVGENQFQVRDFSKRFLGSGTAEEAVNITMAHLPANCAPAVPGTADDLSF